MSKINHMLFYKKYVTKNFKQPLLLNIGELELPRDSVLHWYKPYSTIVPIPAQNAFIRHERLSYIATVKELVSTIGRPRVTGLPNVFMKANKLVARDKRLRPLDSHIDEVNENFPVVLNYNIADLRYSYKKNKYATYNRFTNVLNTIIQDMQNARADFYEIPIPLGELLTLADLKRMAKTPREILAIKVKSMYGLFMLELVNLLLGRSSVFDKLSNDARSTAYFVFRTKKTCTIVNILTLLNQIKLIDDEDFEKLSVNQFRAVKAPKISHTSVLSTLEKFMNSFIGADDEEEPEEMETEGETLPKPLEKIKKIEDAKKALEEAPGLEEQKRHDPIELGRAVLESTLATDAPRSEVNKLQKRLSKAADLKDPITKTKITDITVKEEHISIEEDVIPVDGEVASESVRRNKLQAFDNKYTENIMHRETMQMIGQFNASGALVTDVKVEDKGSVLGETTEYRVSFNPVDGERSTVKFTLPKVVDGTFVANGTKYRMKKQHGDIPIRKIGPYEVNLSSYYGKLAITRSSLAVNSLEKWLFKKIINDPNITAVRGNVFQNYANVPFIYGSLAMNFREVTKGNLRIFLDYKNRDELVKGKELSKIEKKGVVCGTMGTSILLMNKDGEIKKMTPKGDISVGTIYDLLELDESKTPLPQVMIKIFGKNIPLVLLYIHLIGINGIFKHYDVKYTVESKGKRHKESIIKLVFEDISIGINKAPPEALLLLNSLVKLKGLVKYLEFKDFVKSDRFPPEAGGYMLTELGHPTRFEKEFTLLSQMFIDPITKTVLGRINEPTTFLPLIDRSIEMLDEISHPSPTDSRFMREKGYERFNGFIYKEMVKAIRSYKTALNIKKRAVNISEFAVFNAIIKDSTVKPTEDINPLSPIKEQEIITYLGEGGRSKETLVASSRIYHESDVGLLSEAVPDSGTVGINAYLASDTDISDVYGLRKPKDKITTANKHSTSFLITPGVDMDNPVRAVMSHIQQSHVVAMKGAELPLVKTGTEYVIPSKSSSMFCNVAKEDLTVTKVGKYSIVLKDKKGKEHRYLLGIQEGLSEGKIYPHPLITDLKKGDKVKNGDGISWNPYYYEKDDMLGKICYKSGMYINIAMVEGYFVNEDSFAITKEIADQLDSDIRYVKNIVVDFDDSPMDVVSVGDKVLIGDTLMVIEDAITKNMGGKRKQATNSLTDLLRQVPRSSVGGKIAKIEVLYNGLIEDMSPELANLTITSDKNRKSLARELGKKYYSGATYGELRIDGKVIEGNQAVIVISIDSHRGLQSGDKFVFGSQLKATLGDLLDEPIKTESGDLVYGFFSYRAALLRMAYSGIIVPIATKILRHLPKYLLGKYK